MTPLEAIALMQQAEGRAVRWDVVDALIRKAAMKVRPSSVSPSDAEDAAQEVSAAMAKRATEGRLRFPNEAALNGYVYKSVRRRMLETLGHREVSDVPDPDALLAAQAATGTTPEEVAYAGALGPHRTQLDTKELTKKKLGPLFEQCLAKIRPGFRREKAQDIEDLLDLGTHLSSVNDICRDRGHLAAAPSARERKTAQLWLYKRQERIRDDLFRSLQNGPWSEEQREEFRTVLEQLCANCQLSKEGPSDEA